ncbi:MAG TPA: IPT/TIG domain-containing protein, partial [Candidatus Ozemobacteraceae bacterium]|nr:IPT/TIG domain-containing protein [Candidatus Ozemobacteraceae bacterium]
MNKTRLKVLILLLIPCLYLVACNLNPLGRPSGNDSTEGVGAFSPQQIQEFVDAVRDGSADIPVAFQAPAYSFYRFDYANTANANRFSTFLTYDQAVSSPSYGIETTARVLLFDAMHAKVGYSFNFFDFAAGIGSDSVAKVASAVTLQFADNDFLLHSSVPIGSATAVANAVSEVLQTLPAPPQADFTAVPIASPAVTFDLKPDFKTLPAATLVNMAASDEMRAMYESVIAQGVAGSTQFKSNVPQITNAPSLRTSHRGLSKGVLAEERHDEKNYGVSIAPISGIGIFSGSCRPIPGIASSEISVVENGSFQNISLTYHGDQSFVTDLSGNLTWLQLFFHSWEEGSTSNCTNKEYNELTGYGPATSSFNTPISSSTVGVLHCSVMLDGVPVASFTATSGRTATVSVQIPTGKIPTLECSVYPSDCLPALDIQGASWMQAQFKTGVKYLFGDEQSAWDKAVSDTTPLTPVGSAPKLFKDLFQPIGSYPPFQSDSDKAKFTLAVFAGLAAPAVPTADMSDYARFLNTPAPGFTIAISPDSLGVLIKGISSGTFNQPQTFVVSGAQNSAFAYSLDNGTTWNDYSAPVTISADGNYAIIARKKPSGIPTVPINLTIQTMPTISAVSPASGFSSMGANTVQISGTNFSTGATARLTRAGQAPATATSVTFNSATSLTCVFDFTTLIAGAWNVEVTNADGKTATGANLLTIPGPTVSAVTPGTGINTGILSNVQITGSWFSATATARLTRSGQAAVNATSVVFNNATSLTCAFDLTGLPTGSWNVEVTNPTG